MTFIKCILVLALITVSDGQILLPVDIKDRQNLSEIRLTEIGDYGLLRKERKNIPAHLHTGIDIKRPSNNYDNEPVFPLSEGIVISIRRDGPYAQIIIEHNNNGKRFWTLYEHISGIRVNLNELVSPLNPIASFMNKKELDRNGWQFDHFHLEILKVKPRMIKPVKELPERYYSSYSLECFGRMDLEKYYYDPIEFLRKMLKEK